MILITDDRTLQDYVVCIECYCIRQSTKFVTDIFYLLNLLSRIYEVGSIVTDIIYLLSRIYEVGSIYEGTCTI